MNILTTNTKEEAKALSDFAITNGCHKVTIIKLVDCFMVIVYI